MKTATPKTNSLPPTILVIFGVTGDLASRYLLPALYHLFKDELLPEQFEIIGLTRQDMSVETLFNTVEVCVNEVDKVCDPAAIQAMRNKTSLFQLDPLQEQDYAKLLQHLNNIEEKHGVCMNRLYYLSIPPQIFTPIVQNLGSQGLNRSCQHNKAQTRLLVEKPFGHDLASAEILISETAAQFDEEQVYRIDHYLAKETVQNILTFRAYNPIFQDIWDREHIRDIHILASEKIGIEGRAGFYEGLGATRDFIQSHLLQLLALITMELPADMQDSKALHATKQTLLKAVSPAEPKFAHRAQYENYRDEVKKPASTTETFASLGLSIPNSRWQGVPIRLTTGKALDERKTEIVLTFTTPKAPEITNTLAFRIQPNEGIHLQLCVKSPGFEQHLQPAVMDFSYRHTFGEQTHPDAYERVLLDAVRGDRTLFASSEEVLASWRILQPVLDAWGKTAKEPARYSMGTSAQQLLR